MLKRQTDLPYRQGDVLLLPANHPAFRAPTGAMTPKSSTVPGRHVLAYGEATGHHHSLPVTTATLSLDEGNVTYLTVEELTEVTHQEHGAITLDPGLYEVRIQREFSDDDEPIRNVLD
jgi:hypothetical protein